MDASLNLQDPIYSDENAARRHLEAIRWPQGPTCPHCGSVRGIRLQGKSTRPGLFHCRDCRKQFSITVGTVFEVSTCRSTSGSPQPICCARQTRS